VSGPTSTAPATPGRAADPTRPIPIRPPRPGSADSRALAEIGALVQRLRLSGSAVTQLLATDPALASRVPRSELPRLVRSLLDDGQVPDPRTLALVGERLGEQTGQPVDVTLLATRSARIRAAGATGFAVALATLCVYLVIGGLLGGHSSLLPGTPGLVALAAFAVVLAVLGLFEALHISVAQLKTSDLAALAERHPRAVALHREFRTDEGIKRFLAGRQLVVVVTVFFVAGLSSFPDMDVLPGTSIAVPGALHPFLDVGAPGAFFVLWLGQLAPQFLATQRALRMMDTRPAGAAFRVAMLLEAVGFAKPGFWLSAWDHTSERIPSSPVLRWRQAAHELDGVGVLTMTREWSIDADASTLRADTVTAFFGDGREAYIDGSITLPCAATALAMTSELQTGDGDERREVIGTSFSEEPLASGDRVLRKAALPTVGSLCSGDVLVTRLAAHFDATVHRDAVLVERPARVLAWRLALAAHPTCLPPARVTEHRSADGTADLTATGQVTALEPRIGDDGRVVLEHTVAFPQPGTLYVFEWNVEF
jgi:hypothetical protein